MNRLTDAQRDCIEHFETIARETGATIEWITDDDGASLRILETLDGETLVWHVSAEGVAYL